MNSLLFRPPEENYIAGCLTSRIPEKIVGDTVTVFDGGEVYPVGILFRFSVRFRRLATLPEQTEIYNQVNAFRDGRPNEGPTLQVHSGGPEARCFMQQPQGTPHLWKFGFWWSEQVRPGPVDIIFSWPEQNIRFQSTFSPQEIRMGLADCKLLWEMPEEGYQGF